MSNENILDTFSRAVDGWVCEGYYLDIRYLASTNAQEGQIWDAAIALNPLPPEHDFAFRFEAAGFAVGQIQQSKLRKAGLVALLSDAVKGVVEIPGRHLRLVCNQSLDYYSEMTYRDRWFSQLHLQVIGTQRPQPASVELAAIDNALRTSNPPFDGLADATAWLGLRAPEATSNPPSITLRVGPPVDLIFSGCALANDLLSLTLHAHPRFDVERVALAVRGVPGLALVARKQIAADIRWGRARAGIRVGAVTVELERADSALAMLLIEQATVRRQWFVDPTRARNNRLLAVQHYDKELRLLKQAVLDSSDSSKFELGVAALLFLLGFTPAVQLETDAPDLIVTTPGGKLAIVECTTRIADFAAKVGKLVDRRGSLSKHLSATGHLPQVAAVLVCRLPRDQIAAHERDLRLHRVILVSGEDLGTALDRVRVPSDPDETLQAALSRLANAIPDHT